MCPPTPVGEPCSFPKGGSFLYSPIWASVSITSMSMLLSPHAAIQVQGPDSSLRAILEEFFFTYDRGPGSATGMVEFPLPDLGPHANVRNVIRWLSWSARKRAGSVSADPAHNCRAFECLAVSVHDRISKDFLCDWADQIFWRRCSKASHCFSMAKSRRTGGTASSFASLRG